MERKGMWSVMVLALCWMPVAATAGEKITREQAIDACVRLRERAVPCKEAFIDAMIDLRAKHQPRIAKAIAEEGREKVRETGLREVVEDGTGPVEERRKKCAKRAMRRLPPQEMLTALDGCIAKTACNEFVSCVMPLMEKVMFGAKP